MPKGMELETVHALAKMSPRADFTVEHLHADGMHKVYPRTEAAQRFVRSHCRDKHGRVGMRAQQMQRAEAKGLTFDTRHVTETCSACGQVFYSADGCTHPYGSL